MTFPIERAWLLDCSRCANFGVSYELTDDAAQADLVAQGWSEDVFCPACNHAVRTGRPR